MGTYLNVSILNATNRKAIKFNNLWLEYSKDLIDPDLPENFYSGKIGSVLHFQTNEDLTEWAKSAIESNDLKHLGINIYTPLEEARKILRKNFKHWTRIGVAQIKLSGSHFCFHVLQRIRDFLTGHTTDLKYDDEGGSLDRFISYHEAVVISAYCKKCLEIAKALDITVPVYRHEGCKNKMYEDTYKNIVVKVDHYVQENQNFI
jgi:hypothetical protein